jgi:hypothetical protein
MGIYASTQFYIKDFNLSGVWKMQGVPEPNLEHNKGWLDIICAYTHFNRNLNFIICILQVHMEDAHGKWVYLYDIFYNCKKIMVERTYKKNQDHIWHFKRMPQIGL